MSIARAWVMCERLDRLRARGARSVWTLVAGAAAGMAACVGEAPPPPGGEAAVTPAAFAEGERRYDATCAACHGPRGTGTDRGPPLVHRVYEPSHHGDAAFLVAVRQGVRAHHWRFGDMPPVPGVSEPDVVAIVAYVRWLQRQAGID